MKQRHGQVPLCLGIHQLTSWHPPIDVLAPTREGLVLSLSDFRPVGQVAPLFNRGVTRSSALLLRVPGVL